MRKPAFVVLPAVLLSIVALTSLNGAEAVESKAIHGTLKGQVLATGTGRMVLLDNTGKILWKHKGGNCSDIWMLKNGNILLADNNVIEVDPKSDKVVWSYKPEMQKGGGTFACQRLKNGNTMVGENSAGRIVEVDPKGKIVFELKLPDCKPGSHNNLRHVRKLANGNYLVAYKAKAMVREYTPTGKVVFEVKTKPIAFSAVRLPNGNTVVGHINFITEFDPKGKVVWQFDRKEFKDVKIGMICGIHVQPNGNIVMGIYAAVKGVDGASLLEITRDKKLVWRYVAGDRHMMGVQLLDEKGKPLPGPALR
ncbi:MAG: PQQ-binding-like beta-propeller repeat protein [Phycisphaerae bacterium]|jgi:outer membrane protein assembly factor BamB|nr:PQQ-binding-like beta-propeller repeat protein [Phycisphaerae bacterium]